MTADQPTPRQQQRRQTILRIAREMFLSQGYAATSMSAIAANLGGSKGTLYNYFPSKEALFAAVLEAYFDQVRQLMESLALEPGDVASRLKAFGRKFLALILSDDYLGLYRLVTAESERFPEIGATFQSSGFNTRKVELLQFFEAEMNAGRLREADPALVARQFMDLCRSDVQRQVIWKITPRPTEADLAAQADQAAEAIVRLYAPSAPREL